MPLPGLGGGDVSDRFGDRGGLGGRFDEKSLGEYDVVGVCWGLV
jgi:hypothetical protein